MSHTTNFPDGIPYVRYAHLDEDGSFVQSDELRRLTAPIPGRANWVSPAIYFLDPESDDPTRSPKQLQRKCREEGRVIYPVIAETDAFESDLSYPEVMELMQTFIQEYLQLPLTGVTPYFSGHRSIHIHSSLFVTQDGRDALKELAEQFNTDHSDVCDGTFLDTSIYSNTSQFRLSSVPHEDTDLCKTPLGFTGEWPLKRVLSRSVSWKDDIRHPFATSLILNDTSPTDGTSSTPIKSYDTSTGNRSDTSSTKSTLSTQPQHCINCGNIVGDGGRSKTGPIVTAHLKKQLSTLKQTPEDGSGDDRKLDQQSISELDTTLPPAAINEKLAGDSRTGLSIDEEKLTNEWYEKEPFSPYRGVSGDDPGLVIFTQLGEPYEDEADECSYVRGFVHEAVSAVPYGYVRYNCDCRVLISGWDKKNWDHEFGETIVMFGLRSRRGFTISPDRETLHDIQYQLTENRRSNETRSGDVRDTVINILQTNGHDCSINIDVAQNSAEAPVDGSFQTETAKLQKQIEQGDIEDPEYEQILEVASRLLQIDGWDRAWNWTKYVFGKVYDGREFYPEVTHKRLAKLVRSYSDLDHVTVPS